MLADRIAEKAWNKGRKKSLESRPEQSALRTCKFDVTVRNGKEITRLGQMCPAQVTAVLPSKTRNLPGYEGILHRFATLRSQHITHKNLHSSFLCRRKSKCWALPMLIPIYNDFMRNCNVEDRKKNVESLSNAFSIKKRVRGSHRVNKSYPRSQKRLHRVGARSVGKNVDYTVIVFESLKAF
jgi:hypothetical protein